MEERERVLEMDFLDSNDGEFGLSIPEYDTEKSDAEITAVANKLVELDVFRPGGFSLVGVLRANRVITNVQPVDLSAGE